MKAIVFITILIASVSCFSQTYNYKSYDYENLTTGVKKTNPDRTSFKFTEDSVYVRTETDPVMYFKYAILSKEKETNRYTYFRTEKGFEMFVDKKNEVVMVKNDKSQLLCIYHNKQ